MGKKTISIDEGIATGQRINSPRSLEACFRTGIEPEELLPKYACFVSTSINRDITTTTSETDPPIHEYM